VRANKVKKVRKARRWLEKHEKESILCDIRDGRMGGDEVKGIGIIGLSNGNVMTLDAVRNTRSLWTFAPVGDTKADHLMQSGDAICFSRDMVDTLNYSGDERDFFTWLLQESLTGGYSNLPAKWEKMKALYRPFDSLSRSLSSEARIIPTSKLSQAERRFLRVMDSYNCWEGRTLCIGVSEIYNAWTDGCSYIAFSREYLRDNKPINNWGAAAMITLAFHEICHDEEDLGTHIHSMEFYHAYHERTRHHAMWMIGDMPRRMKQAKWEDIAEKEKAKEVKAKKARDRALGLTVKKKVAMAADGITHQPEKKQKPQTRKKKIKRF